MSLFDKIQQQRKFEGEKTVINSLKEKGLIPNTAIRTGEKNYTIDELAEMFVVSMLEENILDRAKLVVKAKSFIKTFVDLKGVPKDYNAMPKKNVNANRLRSLEQKDAEIKFWHTIVKELAPENMETYYKYQEAMLVAKGFKEV